MLYYKFDRVFKARGVEKPFSFLKKAGFSDNLASRIKNNKVLRLNLHHLEKLCILLECTPNDVMEWVPDVSSLEDTTIPLSILKESICSADMTKTINSIPLGKLEAIDKLIKETLKEE